MVNNVLKIKSTQAVCTRDKVETDEKTPACRQFITRANSQNPLKNPIVSLKVQLLCKSFQFIDLTFRLAINSGSQFFPSQSKSVITTGNRNSNCNNGNTKKTSELKTFAFNNIKFMMICFPVYLFEKHRRKKKFDVQCEKNGI